MTDLTARRMALVADEELRARLEGLDLLMPNILGLLPLLKGLAMFGEFGDLRFDGQTVDDALADAIGTLMELEELMAPQVYRQTAAP